MMLTEKELTVLKELKAQENSCVEKYGKYAKEAKDRELASLFETIQKDEQKHYESITQAMNGSIPESDCNDSKGKNYNPTPTYSGDSEDKKNDAFLATDCIGTEKMVSTDYNTDIFASGNSELRKLFADIQIEEQNHAEMLYKYKTVNCMA